MVMKREILFRGQRITGEWIYGSLIIYVERAFIYPGNGSHENFHFYGYEVIPETVGQFTGFLDMNRNKIYESDIIKIPETSVGGIVIFQDGMFCLSSNNVISLFAGWNKSLIIGNIHDK